MPTNNTDNVYSTEYEDSGTPIPSTKIGYDNAASGLEATTVQGAIDEIDDAVDDINTLLTGKFLRGERVEIKIEHTSANAMAADVVTALDNYLSTMDADYLQIEQISAPSQYGRFFMHTPYRFLKNASVSGSVRNLLQFVHLITNDTGVHYYHLNCGTDINKMYDTEIATDGTVSYSVVNDSTDITVSIFVYLYYKVGE